MFLLRLFTRLPLRLLSRRRRGAVMVEYAMLLVAVGVPATVGLLAGGKILYDTYKIGRNAMIAPFP